MSEEAAARRRYHLPSEAQWEYGCRAGSTGRYSFSLGSKAVPKESDENGLSDYAWFSDNSGGMPHAVGVKRPTHGDCMICTVTCGSGARTGMTRIIMRSRQRTIRWAPKVAHTAWTAVVASTIGQTPAGGVPHRWGSALDRRSWLPCILSLGGQVTWRGRSRCVARVQPELSPGARLAKPAAFEQRNVQAVPSFSSHSSPASAARRAASSGRTGD